MKIKEDIPTIIYSPVKGNVIDITEVNDEVFNSKLLGDGVGIIPEEGAIFSPITGEVVSIFPTKHAIGIKNNSGLEILIHMGINTVELDGKSFDLRIQQGSLVTQGDILGEVNFNEIEESGYDSTVIVVVTNTKDYKSIQCELGRKRVGEEIIRVL